MIYYPFDNIPNVKELQLFYIGIDGKASGILLEHLPSFIN